MCNDVKDFPIVNGDGSRTLNDLIEKSPKHLISEVMLEEKYFLPGTLAAPCCLEMVRSALSKSALSKR